MSSEFAYRNRVRVYIYMTALIMILGLLGMGISSVFGWGGTGTTYFLLAGIIINIVAYFFSDKLILKSTRAKELNYAKVPQLFDMVKELTQEANIPMPKLYLIDDLSMNAFATGRSPKHSAVAVTRGLLTKLSPEEIKGVVSHELAHIQNWDMLLMTVVAVIAGFISIIADIFWRSRLVGKAQEKDNTGILTFISIILIVFAPLAAMLIQLAISRRREFNADAVGAQIARNPSYLASALQKISLDRRPLPRLSSATAHLYFSNPFKSEGAIDKLFSTHPPIEERIERLNNLH